jgi:2-polyprenyl-3-methyl-5-hydroxy-6-metoxy-1,4-benzoquinol methylase
MHLTDKKNSMDKTKIAIDVFNKNAELYMGKFMDVSLYDDTFDLFCSSISLNGNVLELACGPGNITKHLLDKRPDLKILGTDLAPNMIALARMNNPTAEFQLMDCRDIGKLEKKYDGIMCGFCLPYLSKEEAIKLIGDACKLLKPGGALYISTMEDDYSKSGFKKGSTGDEIYIHYHQENYLTKALKENGLTIIDLSHKVYPGEEGIITDLVIIAKREG